MSTDNNSIFKAEGLCSGYGMIPVLQEVTLSLAKREILGILGHNGMGKTTLMRALIGHIPTTSGRILLDGRDITQLGAHQRARSGLAYVPQGRDIFAGLTVRENILFGTGKAADVDQAVADFPILGRLLDRPGGALSGGEQQILALARALCITPRVLLLDEPTEGIAPAVVEEIEDHLLRLVKTSDIAVIVVEQDLDFVRTVASRVLMMHRGAVAREVSPEALRGEAMAAEFFGSGA